MNTKIKFEKLPSRNEPFLVWLISFVWLLSILAIIWSLILFILIGNILIITETDIINAFILLSGFLMLPANLILLSAVANGHLIDWNYKIMSCPLWMCNVCIITINILGAMLCVSKIRSSDNLVLSLIERSLREYRHSPRHKHFIDNLQWSMKCCGLQSYKDWFKYDWHDQTQGLEWGPFRNKRERVIHSDSVPLSCCKSGSCIPDYLTELGTYSIHTEGCADLARKLVICTLATNLTIFLLTILMEIMILVQVRKYNDKENTSKVNFDLDYYNVRHIMSVNENFETDSLQLEDSDNIAEEYAEDEISKVSEDH